MRAKESADENLDDSLATRQSLLLRLRNWSDEESWQVFFNRYWKLIYGVAIKAGLAEEEAKEAVQETIIYVAKKIDSYQYKPGQAPSKPGSSK